MGNTMSSSFYMILDMLVAMADLGYGGLWLWRTLAMADLGYGGPWLWRTVSYRKTMNLVVKMASYNEFSSKITSETYSNRPQWIIVTTGVTI